MTTLLLIRHGETDAVGKSIMGRAPGWPLNPNGRRQAETLARSLEKIPIRAVYASPQERAIETAEPIARAHGLTAARADGLDEVRFGDWEGLTMQELDRIEDWKRYNTWRSGVCPPGGEFMAEVQARMVSCTEDLRRRHPHETIAAVSHGDPIRALIANWLGAPMDLLLRFEVFPASVTVAELAEWGPRVVCLNHTGDLPI
jgi:broad specificity phosphatase PhoE